MAVSPLLALAGQVWGEGRGMGAADSLCHQLWLCPGAPGSCQMTC